MKILFDLFPIILFFAAYQIGEKNPENATAWLAALGITLDGGAKPGVFLATVVAIAATFIQIAWVWLRHRKVDTMLWISLVLIVVFGGATLFLHDETFIKWKPTVLYWLFGLTLLVSSVAFHKNLIRTLMEQQVKLPEPVWGQLNAAWIVFFTFMGFANLFVAFSFSTDTWVNFKLFGGMGLMFAFVIAQGMFLAKYIEEEK